MVRRTCALTLVSLALALPARALTVYDPANHQQNVLQAVRALEQIRHQVQQLETMLANLERLDAFTWRDLAGTYADIEALARQGKALSYADAGVYEAFREHFFGPLAFSDDVLEVIDYGGAYELWSRAVIDTLAATLATANAQHQDYLPTLENLLLLKRQAEGAEGNLQALEVDAMLSAHTAEEITKLNQLLAASLNAQTVALGHEATLRANAEATARYMTDEAIQDLVPYDGFAGHTGIPVNWPLACPGCPN